jgi:hypothetical protein
MKRNTLRTFALAAMLAATGAHAQQAAEQQCVQAADVEIMMLTYAPGAVRALHAACRPMLAPGSYLAGPAGEAMVERYEDAAAGVSPASKEAIARVFKGKEGAADMDMGAMLEVMVEAALQKIDAKTCTLVSRGLALIDPLPPKNIAGLVVLALEATAGDKNSPPPLVVCPAAA